MFERILVPLDGSRFGSRALRYAVEVAWHFGAELTLIRVVTPTAPVLVSNPDVESLKTSELSVQLALEEDERNVVHARRYLSRKVREVTSMAIKCSSNITLGQPARSITRFSQKERMDLVIMTTHGKGGLKRAIMGSVADEVIRTSKVPVLVIRPPGRSKK